MKATSLSLPTSSQRFLEFIRMQAQQALLFLGKIPHPSTGKVVQNFEAARLFIDQLEMLQEKTSGNLSPEESEILNVTLADVRLAYVRSTSNQSTVDESNATSSPLPFSQGGNNDAQEIVERKKKFSKNYGS
ncbi:MAG: DUF1844 domain-containing protein [Candidatus Xiphinematobacter sp.]|nr:MAG: DUF1844 domain-containing protein [Candidatus Xiphinematobacter sp.]QQY09436.1 MAG: DUF1844 domain-containing protein [Candidatus Xiphinematobacter sp.]QQY10923.1 MAG: DUF1844 domain-containing protein [Candidatus Xiphinematobacter sp.]QQY11664.1 MAG: DUF1844 domain-containing protein [Candidatus Xiphinematobacter sp.]